MVEGTTRGNSSLIGLILLIGIVSISSMGILLIGGTSISDIQQQSQNERVEQAFTELGHEMRDASTKKDTTQKMDLIAGEQGAIARDETGWIKFNLSNSSGPIKQSFGTIEYVGDDGTHIAYEAGGGWRETGNETQVVSAPPVSYRENTLFSLLLQLIVKQDLIQAK